MSGAGEPSHLGSEPVRRRALMIGVGGTGLGLALSACTGSSHSTGSAYPGEFRMVALAAALENQAVSFYRALLTAARAGKLGAPSPALTSLAEACVSQHAEHAESWNAVLRSGHKPAISGIPLVTHASVMTALSSASTASAAVALAYRLESQAAQTYVAAAGVLTSADGIAAAASIAPVEAMHAAVLRFIGGQDPVPASFPGAKAATPKDLTA